MSAKTKYLIVGIALIAIDILMVLLGGRLNMPALAQIETTLAERIFDITLGAFTVATIVWWAPTSLFGIASALLAEYREIFDADVRGKTSP